jgi:hypothetical protein
MIVSVLPGVIEYSSVSMVHISRLILEFRSSHVGTSGFGMGVGEHHIGFVRAVSPTVSVLVPLASSLLCQRTCGPIGVVYSGFYVTYEVMIR